MRALAASMSVGLLLLSTSGVAVEATGIRVLSAFALKQAFDDIAREFERTTAHTVSISYASAGELRSRIEGGEFGDVALLPQSALEPLLAQGTIVRGSERILARSTIGLSVRAGAPRPDINSADALKRSLLEARSIVYTDPSGGGTSGIHFVSILERLGIVEQMKPKTMFTRIPGPGPGEVVANGEAEIAVSWSASSRAPKKPTRPTR